MKNLNIKINDETHKQLKKMCIDKGEFLTTIIEDIVLLGMKEYKKGDKNE